MDGFLALFFGLSFAVLGVVSWTRRVRCRRAAERLGASFEPRGLLAPGVIAGAGFAIEARKAGKAYRTEVRVEAAGAPGVFLLRRGFFRAAPDWEEARVPTRVSQRAFLWQIELPGVASPAAADRERLLAWLDARVFDSRFAEALARAKVREIEIRPGSVSTRFRGVVLDARKLSHTLDILRGIAGGARGRTAA